MRLAAQRQSKIPEPVRDRTSAADRRGAWRLAYVISIIIMGLLLAMMWIEQRRAGHDHSTTNLIEGLFKIGLLGAMATLCLLIPGRLRSEQALRTSEERFQL